MTAADVIKSQCRVEFVSNLKLQALVELLTVTRNAFQGALKAVYQD